MKRQIFSVLAILALATPASAALKAYTITGDQSTLFPTCGTVFRPDTQSGIVVINDTGNGTPTLVELNSQNIFFDIVGGNGVSGVPGTTVTLDSRTVANPTDGQTGSGNTTTTISWGALSGWTQTGRLACNTLLGNGDTITGSGDPRSSCVPFVGFEGTGPPAPLQSGTFNIDPFTFTNGDKRFDSPSVEFVNLGTGAVTANLQIAGGLLPNSPVPALPLIGVAGLGAALLYLGARAIRRRSS